MSDTFSSALLLVAAAGFAALWLAWRPPMYLASDEAGNLALAGVLRSRTPFADVAGRQLPEEVAARDGHRASRYPPGLAALLVPFTWLGPRAAFLLPLGCHLAAFAIFAWLLRRAGLSPLWALLYLFYPTAVLHSRTLMSNLPEALCLLGAFALLLRGGRAAALSAGLVLGLGLVIRPTTAVGAAVLALGALWRGRRDLLAAPALLRGLLRSDAALLALGALPGLALVLGYNWFVFGSPLDSGYARVGNLRLFSLAALGRNLPRYALILLAVYPLMLFAPALYRGKWKLEVVLLPLAYLLFYSCYGWFDAGSSWAETAVRAPRFLLPAAPFLILAYAGILAARLRAVPGLERLALGAALLGGLLGSGALCHRHWRAQQELAVVRDGLYARTAEGSLLVAGVEAARLIQDDWGLGRRGLCDYAESRGPALEAAAASGRAAYLVTLSRPGRGPWAPWDAAVQRALAEQYALAGGESLIGGWRLGVWKLAPRGDRMPP